jgi:hypothetical protein
MYTTQQNVFFSIFSVSLPVYIRTRRMNCHGELLAEPSY